MSDPTVEIRANTGPLEAGMQNAVNAVRGGVSGMQEHMDGLNGMFGKLTAGFAAFTAILAGGSAMKQFVSAAGDATKEALTLGKQLGITATEASYLADAVEQSGVSSDVVGVAASKITMTLLKNEKAFKDLGVATRDSSGHLRNTKDIMLETNEALRQFNEGTDRNIEGMKIYNRQWGEVSGLVGKFTGVTEESRRQAEEMNAVIGQESVTALKEYKMAQHDVKEVIDGVSVTIGREIMPRLTEMGKWFGSIGPDAVKATRVAMAGYLVVQDAIKDSIKAVWNALSTSVGAIVRAITGAFGMGGTAITGMEFFQNCIKVVQIVFITFRAGVEQACALIEGSIKGTMRIFQGFAEVAKAAFSLNWDGVVAASERMKTGLLGQFNETMNKAREIAARAGVDINKALFTDLSAAKPVTAIKTKDPSLGEYSDGGKEEKAKKDKDERMKQWEADLLKLKNNYMLENDMREMSLSDESAYWSKLLATLQDGDAVKSSVRKKFAESEFNDTKRQAKQRMDILGETAQFEEKLELGRVDAARAAAEQQLGMGEITNAQMLQLEERFENQKYAINEQALRARLELLSKDPTTNLVERQKTLDQLLLIEQKHSLDLAKIQGKQALESNKYATSLTGSIRSTFASSIASMLQGTATFTGAIKGMFKGIVGAFADMAAQMAADWVMSLITRRVAQAASAVSQVMSNAAVAASAAFASTAAIPIIGPGMAPAAAGLAFSGAASWAPLASARDGFDIPAGLNPLTQLHEREMVLPAAQADAVRDMANGKGGGGGDTHLHVHAVDAKSVERLFRDNGRHIASALQNQVRNNAVRGVK